MPETLGSLCDKLTIVKLKQFHSKRSKRFESLHNQEVQLTEEINQYFSDALSGLIPVDNLSFASNKVYKRAGMKTKLIKGHIGQVIAELANVNCALWHEQEKVYDFTSIPVTEKDIVVKRLAILNLERNNCIDKINSRLTKSCTR